MNSSWIKLTKFVVAVLPLLPSSIHAAQCSIEVVNGPCTLYIDRSDPVAPPTIYVRRGSTVTVEMTNPRPFEHLTLDKKSATAVVPPDQFESGFSNITNALSGFQIVTLERAPPAQVGGAEQTNKSERSVDRRPAPPECPFPGGQPTSLGEFKACQKLLGGELKEAMIVHQGGETQTPELNFGTWAYSRLCWVRSLFLPPQPSGLSPDNPRDFCFDLPSDLSPPVVPSPKSIDEWVHKFGMGADQGTTLKNNLDPGAPGDDCPTCWNTQILELDGILADQKKVWKLSTYDFQALVTTQKALHAASDTAEGYLAKMDYLLKAVNKLTPYNDPSSMKISDTREDDKDYEVQTWDLNATNRLTAAAAYVKADKPADQISWQMGTLSDAISTQAVTEFKIEFINEPRLEISSGVLVPIRPYHSYSVATTLAGSTATANCPQTNTALPSTCGTVQQSSTLAIVPDVSLNFLFHEFAFPDRQRAAFMGTIVVGYNSTLATAALGAGLSFSYRSMVFNFTPIVDQEQHLTNGFQVSQSAGTATSPTTAPAWKVNPAIGISLRIPLGGGSK